MKFISKMLHLEVRESKEEVHLNLPAYIVSRYRIRTCWIANYKVFILEAKTELAKTNEIVNHIKNIRKAENIPAVLLVNSLTARKKQGLIDAGIPFIVEGKQIYLPFLGIVLSNRNDIDVSDRKNLIPSAQALLFYYIERCKSELYVSEAVRNLGFSAMTISRGVQQLEQMALISTYKDKVQKVIKSDYTGVDLAGKAEEYIINPIKKEGYISQNLVNDAFFKAGDSALAEYSMINPPRIPCYATKNTAEIDKNLKTEVDDESKYVKVQLWRYDPSILSENNVVDRLSLAASYIGETDERILEAVEEMQTEYWRA